jgi:hypothetical protein
LNGIVNFSTTPKERSGVGGSGAMFLLGTVAVLILLRTDGDQKITYGTTMQCQSARCETKTVDIWGSTTYIYIYVNVYIYLQMHMYIIICIYTYTYIYIHNIYVL